MKLIVGLGNPGAEYTLTRHNAGFLVLEKFARANGITFKINKRFNALIGEGTIGEEKIFSAMPQAFMNLSGQSVGSILSWFKIEARDMLVVIDDIALPFGAIRIRVKGSDGGHNGLKSIIDSIGTQEFPRIRLGILGRKNMKFTRGSCGRNTEPAVSMAGECIKSLSNYVLDKFTKAEQKNLPEILDRAAQACECWVKEGVNMAMNRFNKNMGARE